MFLLWYRIPWITCYNRYYIYCGGFVTCVGLPLHRKSSFRAGVWYFILTFCGCSMNIFVYFGLLLGFVIFIIYILYYNNYNNHKQKGMVGHSTSNKSNIPKKPKWWEIILAKIKLFFTLLRDFIYKNRPTIVAIILIPKIILILPQYYEYISYIDLYPLLEFNSYYYSGLENSDLHSIGYNINFLHFIENLHLTLYQYIYTVLTAILVLFGLDSFNFMGPNKTFVTMNNGNIQDTPQTLSDYTRWRQRNVIDHEIVRLKLEGWYNLVSPLWKDISPRLTYHERNRLSSEYADAPWDCVELAFMDACKKIENSNRFANARFNAINLTSEEVGLTPLEKVAFGKKVLAVFPRNSVAQRFLANNEVFRAHENAAKFRLSQNDYSTLIDTAKGRNI